LDERAVIGVRSARVWLFRDRQIRPHRDCLVSEYPLVMWIIAMSLRSLVRGDTDTTPGVIAALALVVRAAGEIVRGVNPGRRFLGAVLLGGLIVRVSMTA
jgi:hypothetical protein